MKFVNGVCVCVSIQVLILLDTTPDEALLSEGVAREVVNRIQKLRKKVVSILRRQLSYDNLVSKYSVVFC